MPAGLLLNTREAFAGGKRILQVDIHLESLSLLNEFLASDHEQLPAALRQLLEGETEQSFNQVGTIHRQCRAQEPHS